MQGRLRIWLGCGLALLLCTAVSAAEIQHPFVMSDPGYNSQAIPGHLVSTNASAMNIEARLAALESALAEEEEVVWEDVSAQKWSGKVGGRIMGDFVMYPYQSATNVAAVTDQQNYFEFRRLRLFASGSGYGVYDYKFQIDFEDEKGFSAIKDMYVGIHEIPVLGYLRFGHFKAPMSLEELTSAKYITFMERGLPNVFAPSRRVGMCSYNNGLDDAVHLSYGVFFNDVDPKTKEREDDAQGVEFTVRSVWTPIYTANGRGLVHLGGGLRYVDDRDDQVSFNARPEVHENTYFLETGKLDARDFTVFNLEAAAVHGPLSLQSELFVTRVNMMGAGDVDLYGAYVYGSYFLTGESRAYKRKPAHFDRVKPHTNFWIVPTCDGPAAGWGAWELAARWSMLDYTDPGVTDALGGQLNDLTLGVNWYWNPYTRMMFNYIHPFCNHNGFGESDADILAMRMQVDF